MLGIQSEITRDTRRKKDDKKRLTGGPHVGDTGFEITVINVFKNIDYQMKNFNKYLKAIKLIKQTL